MGHFGGAKINRLLGEIDTTIPYRVRTGVATADIAFGDFVEQTYRTLSDYMIASGLGVREYEDFLDEGVPVLGVATYTPNTLHGQKPLGYYKEGRLVNVLTSGDIAMRVKDQDLCIRGNPCYVALYSGKYIATSEKLGAKFQVGIFGESIIATTTNTVTVSVSIDTNII